MGTCCGCFRAKAVKRGSVLSEAKLMTKTKFNKRISRKINKNFISRAQQEYLCQQNFEYRLLLIDKYSDFTQILYNLYLTGIGGINVDNMTEKRVKCVVTVTYETPGYDIKGIQNIRVPVEDEEYEDLSIYFDEVTDQMHKWMSHQMRVVVHCLCGVSRSAAIVLAYLMKYKGMRLKGAFIYVKNRRPFIKPNNGFFRQLIGYEKKLFKTNTVQIIKFKARNGKIIEAPDVMIQLYREDVETASEQDEGGTIDSAYTKSLLSSRFDTDL